MPKNETVGERIHRKAGELRASLIKTGVVVSPDPETPFADLPYKRQVKWLALAETYCEHFPGRW